MNSIKQEVKKEVKQEIKQEKNITVNNVKKEINTKNVDNLKKNWGKINSNVHQLNMELK